MTTIRYALNDLDAPRGSEIGQKPHHNQEKRHANDELEFVVKATMQVATQHLASPWLKDALAQKYH